jgi:hypothetical protein
MHRERAMMGGSLMALVHGDLQTRRALALFFLSDQRGNEEGFIPSVPERGYGVDECECERGEW